MEVKEAINKRRSIRKYEDKPVSEEIINELLEAARLAPSAYNAQPWKFVIAKENAIFNKFREENVFTKEFVYNAPLIIVCCCDSNVYPEKAKDNFNLRELAIGDMGIASQNLVLRATELGLGSCYVGLLNREKIKNILNIPGKYIIPYVLTIGYADEEPAGPGRKSTEELLLN